MDSHNKSRKLDLALEKFWVTQFGWLRLCTTVAMEMKITNCWKLFRYGVKREHYDKFISIRELLEQITVDFFKNSSTTDTETLKKTLLTLMKLITKALCIPVGDSTIPVILLEIQRSGRYRI